MLNVPHDASRLARSLLLFGFGCALIVGPSAAQPTVDGDLSDPEYQTVATKQNDNTGTTDRVKVAEIVYFADDASNILYVGVEGKDTSTDQSGIGLMLNVQAVFGEPAATNLEISSANHYLGHPVRADFEVDYMFSMDNNAAGDDFIVYHVGEQVSSAAWDRLGDSDGSGTSITNVDNEVFDKNTVTLAFDNGSGDNLGFEMSIPYAQLGSSGVSEVGALEAFAFEVEDTGDYSDLTVPGDLGSTPGADPNFHSLSGGPFHDDKLFTASSSGAWTDAGLWSSGTVPFAGANTEVDADVTLNTDATVHDLSITTGNTFTASDGNARTLTLKNGGDLTSNGTFSANDGTVAVTGVPGTTSLSGSLTLNNVTADDPIDFGSNNATVNGTYRIDRANDGGTGEPVLNPPQFGPSSTLVYNTGLLDSPAREWSATSGPGHPANVTLQNNTRLDLSGATIAAPEMAGDLIINPGSELDMDDMSASLTVDGIVFVPDGGTLTLGSREGGDLIVGGNTFTMDGTFNGNNRLLKFNGGSSQAVGGTLDPLSIGSLEIDNANGVTLNTGMEASDELILTDGTLTANGNLTLTSSGESSSARIAGTGTGTVSGEVTAERFVERKDGNADDSHWRFLSAPLNAPLDDADGSGEGSTGNRSSLLSNTWTQGDGMTGANVQGSGADPSVFHYDETAGVGSDLTQGWAAVPDLTAPTGDANIENQEGFAVFLFQDRDFDGTDEGFPRTFSATGTVPNAENNGTDVSLPVTCTDNDGTGSDGCTDAADGWNLVANPFLSHFDWAEVTLTNLDNPAYIYDADNDRYQLTDGTNSNGGDPFIAPFQAVFVKANAADGNENNVSLSVNSDAKSNTDNLKDDNAELKSTTGDDEPVISLQLRDGPETEETRITYREDAAEGKDRYDGYQLTPLSGGYHLVASEMDNHSALFDSQYRPAPITRDTVDLALAITQSGSYTLEADTLQNLPSDWQVILENRNTGARWDLRDGEAIPFDYTAPESNAAQSTEKVQTALAQGRPVVAQADSSGSGAPDFRLFVGPDAALPVELAGFDAATESGQSVTLSWQTASETRNVGFAVQRRVEPEQGDGWTQVGFVDGAGTTNQPQSYRFTDNTLPFAAERVTYRLQQKDLDGTTTPSDEVTVTLGPPSEARLYAPFPNPARGQATLRYEVPEATSVEIVLYDAIGQRVRTVARTDAEGRRKHQVDLSGLASGMYFFQLTTGSSTQAKTITVSR